MHHRRDIFGEIELERGELRAELRGEVFGCEYGGAEALGDDEGGDVVIDAGGNG